MATKSEFIKVFKALFLSTFPEFRGGYHYPVRAKVVKVHESGGTVNDFNKRYSVDVQPLKPDRSVDDDSPVIVDAEIPVIWAGLNRGIFALPVVGAIVRVAYYYNDPAHPFVDAILGDGFTIPDHAVGSLIIQHSSGKKFTISTDGKVNITMDTTIDGDVVINGTLSVSDDTTIQGKLSVAKDVTMSQNTTINGALTVAGAAAIAGGITTSGISGSSGGAMPVTGDIAVSGNITATGSIIDTGGNTNHHTHSA